MTEPTADASPPQLLPAENLALSVAFAQVSRGEEPAPNVAIMCVLALARITGRDDTTGYAKAVNDALTDQGATP
jgi:hypothetical protein